MSTNAKTRYNISKVFGPAVPYNIPEDSKTIADNMAGIAINENIAYCAKRSQTFSDIFVIENISTAGFKEFMNKTPLSVSIPYAVHGMTYHNNYLYMTCYKNKIIKMPVSSIGKIAAEYTVTEDGNGYIPQSITYYGTVNNEDLFIVGVEKMQKNGAFFYMIGSLSNGKFVEKKRFYVNNSAGYEQPQDIFYHSKYGLFIVTNKKADGAFTIYNMLLCAKIPDELSSVENIGTYYPTSEFRFNGNSNYSKLVVKSIYITDDGTLYLSTNATTASTSSDNYDKDAIFRAQNPSFKNGSQKNVLQDIFYSPSHGLFYVTFTGTTRIYRLLPEQIEQASDEPLVPVAVYNKDDAIYEIESLVISDSGTLYIAQNCDSEFTKDDAVTQIGALSFISK